MAWQTDVITKATNNLIYRRLGIIYRSDTDEDFQSTKTLIESKAQIPVTRGLGRAWLTFKGAPRQHGKYG